jgi:hypothetical protein
MIINKINNTISKANPPPNPAHPTPPPATAPILPPFSNLLLKYVKRKKMKWLDYVYEQYKLSRSMGVDSKF